MATVEELWNELKHAVKKPDADVRPIVRVLMSTPDGRAEIMKGISEKLPGKSGVLWRIGEAVGDETASKTDVNLSEMKDWINSLYKAASILEPKVYWLLLWLGINADDSRARLEAARRFKAIIKPNDDELRFRTKLSEYRILDAVTRPRLADLLDAAAKAEPSRDTSAIYSTVANRLRTQPVPPPVQITDPFPVSP